jgi:hypothetical protein
MVCTRVPGSRPDRRRQKVWQVPASYHAVIALMDYLRCEGIQRLVLECSRTRWVGMSASRWVGMTGDGKGPAGGPAGPCGARVVVVVPGLSLVSRWLG